MLALLISVNWTVFTDAELDQLEQNVAMMRETTREMIKSKRWLETTVRYYKMANPSIPREKFFKNRSKWESKLQDRRRQEYEIMQQQKEQQKGLFGRLWGFVSRGMTSAQEKHKSEYASLEQMDNE